MPVRVAVAVTVDDDPMSMHAVLHGMVVNLKEHLLFFERGGVVTPRGSQLHQACLPSFAFAFLQHVSSGQQAQRPQPEEAAPLPPWSEKLAHTKLPAAVQSMSTLNI